MRAFSFVVPILFALANAPVGFAKEIERGTLEIGGGLDVSYGSHSTKVSQGETSSTDAQNISAILAFYVAPNLAAGLAWDYRSADVTSGGDRFESSLNVIGPLVTLNLGLNDAAALRFTASIGKAHSEAGDTFSVVNVDGLGWSVGGAIRYFLTDSVALDGGIDYLSLSMKESTTSTEVSQSGFSTALGISVFIK